MKQINIYFEDKDFDNLKKFKGELSWKDFILMMYNHLKETKLMEVKNGK